MDLLDRLKNLLSHGPSLKNTHTHTYEGELEAIDLKIQFSKDNIGTCTLGSEAELIACITLGGLVVYGPRTESAGDCMEALAMLESYCNHIKTESDLAIYEMWDIISRTSRKD